MLWHLNRNQASRIFLSVNIEFGVWISWQHLVCILASQQDTVGPFLCGYYAQDAPVTGASFGCVGLVFFLMAQSHFLVLYIIYDLTGGSGASPRKLTVFSAFSEYFKWIVSKLKYVTNIIESWPLGVSHL